MGVLPHFAGTAVMKIAPFAFFAAAFDFRQFPRIESAKRANIPILVFTLGLASSAALWAIGVIGFGAYETNKKPQQEQISLSPVIEAYGPNRVYRTCRGLFYDGKLDAKEFMLLCQKDAQKERERKDAELSTPAKPQTLPWAADASR